MNPVSRRDLFKVGGAFAAVIGSGHVAQASPASPSGTFGHGVASGDPLPDGVLLWTRVTPVPEALPGSGLGADCDVDWEVARDESFIDVVASGTTRTGAYRDHTVKVAVSGLAPHSWYWFRFHAAGTTSVSGRTRTAPAEGAAVQRLRLGVVSCSNWQAGHFAGYRHLAQRGDLDAVLHLGDYLYEYGVGEYQAREVVVRPHDPATEMTTLADYRRRHAQYKTDPNLQLLHRSVPFVVTWDDHESANDAYDGGAENHTDGAEGTWAERVVASRQAYAEWMPVRYEPGGALYRRLGFGQLAELSMLDLRSYRTRQASSPADPGVDDPARTITGDAQMAWLKDGLTDSGAQWKLVGNPVMIAPVRFPSTLSSAELEAVAELTGTPVVRGVPYNVDQWDGYTADRAELLGTLRDHAVTDTVFLTGDIHSAWAAELPSDPLRYPLNRESLGVELVCTSMTSDNVDDLLGVAPRTASVGVEAAIRANNPHIKHLELDSHGFSVLDVTPERVRMDWYAVADRTDPRSPAAHAASFAVQAGTQRVTPSQEAVR